MADDRLVDNVIQHLKRCGLREIPQDGPSDGGFAVQSDLDVVYLVWAPADDLSTVAFMHLANGNTGDPTVLHMGTAKHVMANAMRDLLSSAGFDAELSTDSMAPATVEVRNLGAS